MRKEISRIQSAGTQPSEGDLVKKRVKGRFYRALDYLSIYAFILVVYGAALIPPYLIIQFVWFLLGDEIRSYPFVSSIFTYARVALALLSIVCAVIHGALSTWSQIRLDLRLTREDKEAA